MHSDDEREQLSEAIAATYQVLGQTATPTALEFMVGDLSIYPVAAILSALESCRREVGGRFVLKEIIARIEAEDGRLLPNEAWAVACQVSSESESAAVTDEIIEALNVANDCPDQISGRMAFIDCYKRLCQKARNEGAKSVWFMSLGSDPAGRESAIEKALAAGRITQKKADFLLPNLAIPQLTNLLASATEEAETNEHAAEALKGLREMFDGKTN
jgi:hypothetical protein